MDSGISARAVPTVALQAPDVGTTVAKLFDARDISVQCSQRSRGMSGEEHAIGADGVSGQRRFTLGNKRRMYANTCSSASAG